TARRSGPCGGRPTALQDAGCDNLDVLAHCLGHRSLTPRTCPSIQSDTTRSEAVMPPEQPLTINPGPCPAPPATPASSPSRRIRWSSCTARTHRLLLPEQCPQAVTPPAPP